MSLNKEYPWLDENFEPLPDEKLRELAKSWKPQVWESYLKTIEGSCKEYQPKNLEFFDDKADRAHISQFYQTLKTGGEYKHLEKFLSESIKILSLKQKVVISGLYFEKLSTRQVAVELNISRTSVCNVRDQALKELKALIEKNYLSIKCKNGNSLSTVDNQLLKNPFLSGVKNLFTTLGLIISEES